MNLNDINLQFHIGKHGSSEARLHIDGNVYDFFPSHIFNEPFTALLSATVCLANGADRVYFFWSDDSRQYDWKFTQVQSEHNLLDVLIYQYADFMGYNHCQATTNKLSQQISFRVSRDFWIAIVTSEAEKIARMLSYQHYKIDRSPQDFPWQELKELKKYINKK